MPWPQNRQARTETFHLFTAAIIIAQGAFFALMFVGPPAIGLLPVIELVIGWVDTGNWTGQRMGVWS